MSARQRRARSGGGCSVASGRQRLGKRRRAGCHRVAVCCQAATAVGVCLGLLLVGGLTLFSMQVAHTTELGNRRGREKKQLEGTTVHHRAAACQEKNSPVGLQARPRQGLAILARCHQGTSVERPQQCQRLPADGHSLLGGLSKCASAQSTITRTVCSSLSSVTTTVCGLGRI